MPREPWELWYDKAYMRSGWLGAVSGRSRLQPNRRELNSLQIGIQAPPWARDCTQVWTHTLSGQACACWVCCGSLQLCTMDV